MGQQQCLPILRAWHAAAIEVAASKPPLGQVGADTQAAAHRRAWTPNAFSGCCSEPWNRNGNCRRRGRLLIGGCASASESQLGALLCWPHCAVKARPPQHTKHLPVQRDQHLLWGSKGSSWSAKSIQSATCANQSGCRRYTIRTDSRIKASILSVRGRARLQQRYSAGTARQC